MRFFYDPRVWWSKKEKVDPDRLATLSRRLDDAESQLRMLRTEWVDTLDRLDRIMGRMNKRAARDAAAAEQVELPVNGAETTPTSPAAALVALRRSRGLGPMRRG